MRPSKPSTFAGLFSALLLLVLVLLSATAPAAGAQTKRPTTTTTHIRVYYQETVAGPNQTSFIVASLPQSNSTSTAMELGQVRAFDNPLTEGPLPGSKLVGRSQGLAAVVSRDSALLVEINHVFTAGRFNGSSLATFGTILPTVDAEQTVVGGSGQFRMARGYLRRKLIAATATAYTVRFDLYVEH